MTNPDGMVVESYSASSGELNVVQISIYVHRMFVPIIGPRNMVPLAIVYFCLADKAAKTICFCIDTAAASELNEIRSPESL